MSIFEKKLAAFREKQERKRRKPMSKQDRTQIIKRLREAMEKTKDPAMLLKLSKQVEKLMPKPGQETRGRKSKPVGVQSGTLRDLYTGSVFDAMSDGELVIHHLVLQIEKRQRLGELKTKAERDVFIAEVLPSLREHERAAYEALSSAEAA